MAFPARKLLRYLQSLVKEGVTRKVFRNKELQAWVPARVWLPVAGRFAVQCAQCHCAPSVVRVKVVRHKR
jgi:hypothetical protein